MLDPVQNEVGQPTHMLDVIRHRDCVAEDLSQVAGDAQTLGTAVFHDLEDLCIARSPGCKLFVSLFCMGPNDQVGQFQTATLQHHVCGCYHRCTKVHGL